MCVKGELLMQSCKHQIVTKLEYTCERLLVEGGHVIENFAACSVKRQNEDRPSFYSSLEESEFISPT